MPKPTKYWEKPEIFQRLHELNNAGIRMTFHEAMKHDSRFAYAYKKHFATFGEAVIAAGLDYEGFKPEPYTRERIIERLRELHNAGVPMQSSAIYGQHSRFAKRCKTLFGSVALAIEAAGLEYQTKSPPHYVPRKRKPRQPRPSIWPPERITGELHRLHSEGVPMNATIIKANHGGLYSAIIRNIGSLSAALKLAELEPSEGRWLWSKARVIEGLQKLNSDGVEMSSRGIKIAHSGLHNACYKHYGSPNFAVIAAGLEPYVPPVAPPVARRKKAAKPEPTPLRSMRQNPFEVAADLSRKSNGVVLNSIVSPLGMSEAQRTRGEL